MRERGGKGERGQEEINKTQGKQLHFQEMYCSVTSMEKITKHSFLITQLFPEFGNTLGPHACTTCILCSSVHKKLIRETQIQVHPEFYT